MKESEIFPEMSVKVGKLQPVNDEMISPSTLLEFREEGAKGVVNGIVHNKKGEPIVMVGQFDNRMIVAYRPGELNRA